MRIQEVAAKGILFNLKHKTLLKILYAFFWVIPRRLNFICRRFGTLSVPSSQAGRCLQNELGWGHVWGIIGEKVWLGNGLSHQEGGGQSRGSQTECSETSAYKFQSPGNHPKKSVQHSVHGDSLKSRLLKMTCDTLDISEGARPVKRMFRTPVLRSFLRNYTLLFSSDAEWDVVIVKGKGHPATGRGGPRSSGQLKAPDFLDVSALQVWQVVSLMHWPPLPQNKSLLLIFRG